MIEAQRSMVFYSPDCGGVPASVSVSRFIGASGVEECHLIVRPTEWESIGAQLEWVLRAYRSALEAIGLGEGTCVMRRFFCSDLANQAPALEANSFSSREEPDEPCAISWVGQPPAPPAKVALWAYHVSDPGGSLDKRKEGSTLLLRRGDLQHLWTAGVTSTREDCVYSQTRGIFGHYERMLGSRGMRLADNAIRTWFFVRDVDADYQGLVAARREVLAQRGLTPETHFIASTGIQGQSVDVAAKVMMDAYAIAGVGDDQIRFLSAPDYLSPTYVYGVTFERGVSVAYRDRAHIQVSGTASIDHMGRIVHQGDLLKQLDRTLENIEALLHQAGAGIEDACVFIAYVRDPSDLPAAERGLQERLGPAPVQVVMAPVCRPGWLIEIECQAIVPALNPGLPWF